jgi:hypothetical protein
MAILTWGASADKKYESGVDRGVLYMKSAGTYPLGVAWEGLISVTEKPGGAEVTDLWANNEKYAALVATETFEGTIEAYTFPDEFLEAMAMEEHGTDPGVIIGQQSRIEFGLCWRTRAGSDADGSEANEKLHIVYGCLAKPSEVQHSTVNDSPEAVSFSWDFTTTPVAATGFASLSKITLDESVITGANYTALTDELWGDGAADANLPLPDVLFALLV